ncbi:hypothetical protein DRN87_00400 [Candidatus Geothermarchaeota archaeon]|nr:MAG: hypothetical protein DRN87_00400 [Candidatus Geothermarchaeota archaeon]HEW93713.1 hypothetical protein [Thermoprotei archaeon]
MMKMEISFIVHATEDYDKILNALKNTLGVETRRFSRRDLSGHYGNPLIYCKINLDSRESNTVLTRIRDRLDPIDLQFLKQSIDEYYDRNSLYIRLDKQYLCKGQVKFVITDPIKIVVRNIKLDRLMKILFE